MVRLSHSTVGALQFPSIVSATPAVVAIDLFDKGAPDRIATQVTVNFQAVIWSEDLVSRGRISARAGFIIKADP
ncbi:hypothetical protein RRG08_018451 [Elysia crispata]|uniref:Uncharacterized protein n=1 Tax=Elysia crispata TaxID=231223 RepID=A0AAE0YTG5_9GAST|nr:hypothetical protein RRG08_018451 [Elysia crispata]